MSTGSIGVTENAERLTWDEVRRRYPDQWVTLVDIDWVNETDFEFRSAIAIGHGAHRRLAIAEAHPQLDRYPGFGCYFTGRIRAPLRDFIAPDASAASFERGK